VKTYDQQALLARYLLGLQLHVAKFTAFEPRPYLVNAFALLHHGIGVDRLLHTFFAARAVRSLEAAMETSVPMAAIAVTVAGELVQQRWVSAGSLIGFDLVWVGRIVAL
jgi:hypothetical protein